MKRFLKTVAPLACAGVLLAADQPKLFIVEATIVGPHDRTELSAEKSKIGNEHGYLWTKIKIVKSPHSSLKPGETIRLVTTEFDADLIGKTLPIVIIATGNEKAPYWLDCNSLQASIRIAIPIN